MLPRKQCPPWPQLALTRIRNAVQGVLQVVGAAVQQVFQRLPCASPSQAADVHFQHFTSTVWPRLKGQGAGGAPCCVWQLGLCPRARHPPGAW